MPIYLKCFACNSSIEVPEGASGDIKCVFCGAERGIPKAAGGSAHPRTSRLAILSAVLGLLLVPLLPALIGTAALSSIRESQGTRSGRGLAGLGITLGLLTFLAAAAALYTWIRPENVIPRLFPEEVAARQDLAAKAILTMAAQEITFREEDHDGNDIHDYWVADVAGLYHFPMEKTGHPELVAIDMARADAAPLAGHQDVFEAREGYVFQAVPGVDRRVEFAFTAYPERYGIGGTKTFYVDERHDVWERDLGGMPADHHIGNPEKEGWTRKY